MLACPACRHANPNDVADCVQCGTSLMGATLLGMVLPLESGGDEAPEAAVRSQTLFGVAAPTVQPRSEPSRAPAPVTDVPAPAPKPETPATAVPATGAPATAAPAAKSESRTLFGVAAPKSMAPGPVAVAPKAGNAPATVPATAPRANAPSADVSDDAKTIRRPARVSAEKRPAAAAQVAEAPRPPAEPKRPGATTLLHQEASEIMAAARISQASAEEERGAQQRRLRKALWGLLCLALVAVFVGFLTYRNRHRFQAEVGGELRVQRDAQGYAVRVRITTSGPAHVLLPDGATDGPKDPISGTADVSFRLPEGGLPVGDNHLQLRVSPVDDPESQRTLALQVRVYYRFVYTPAESPKAGGTFELRMQLMPGWALSIKGARIERQKNDELTVTLDAAPLLAAAERATGAIGEYPLSLNLVGPAGESATFTEGLRFPLPPTRLAILTPLNAALLVKESADVEGLASPGAVVRAGAATVTADASGRFRLSVPLAAPGRAEFDVEARAIGQAPVKARVAVERLTLAEVATRKAEALHVVSGIRTPPPTYASLLTGTPTSTSDPIRIQGRILATRRGDPPGVDELQLATCPSGCPYWLTTTRPVFAALGEEAVVVGRLTGTHTFTTQKGQSVLAPRLEAMAVVPRR